MPLTVEQAPITQAILTNHVFVCTGKSCSSRDSNATFDALREELKRQGLLYGKHGSLAGRVVLTQCGSVGLCAAGPAVLVYPEGLWYHSVTPADVPELVQCLIEGRRLERLMALDLSIGSPPD
jgi:(2Fe-2S) ferredoxin